MWSAIAAICGIILALIGIVVKVNDAKKKQKDVVDAEIAKISNADDVVHMAGKLRK